MKIGDVSFDSIVFLAPMAGITDWPFRVLCKKEGCGLTYSEMISAKGLYYNDKKTEELLIKGYNEVPFAIQIFGSDPNIMEEITLKLSNYDVDIIDINMGCPTPKIIKNGDGSALMKDIKLAGKIIKKVSSVISKPITIKIRKGWDDDSVNAVEFAKMAEYCGADAITVHGRTREQFYTGKADWDIIRQVKKAVSIPVIGNGDIIEPQDVKRMLEHTECDGIMIGRGARGNPWIFRRVNEYLKTGKLIPEPTPHQKINKIIEHLDLMMQYKGESSAVKEMRKHIAWYIKGLRSSILIKERINKTQDINGIKRILFDYKNMFDKD